MCTTCMLLFVFAAEGPCSKCPEEYRPLCGSNGVTYGNQCMFSCARITNASKFPVSWQISTIDCIRNWRMANRRRKTAYWAWLTNAVTESDNKRCSAKKFLQHNSSPFFRERKCKWRLAFGFRTDHQRCRDLLSFDSQIYGHGWLCGRNKRNQNIKAAYCSN